MSNFIKDFDPKKLALYVLSQVIFSSTNVEGQPKFAGNINIPPSGEMGNNLAETVNLLNAVYHLVCDQNHEGGPFQVSKTGVDVYLNFHPELFPRQQLMMAINTVEKQLQQQTQLPKISKLAAFLQVGAVPTSHENDNAIIVEKRTTHSSNVHYAMSAIETSIIDTKYNSVSMYPDLKCKIHHMIDLSQYPICAVKSSAVALQHA